MTHRYATKAHGRRVLRTLGAVVATATVFGAAIVTIPSASAAQQAVTAAPGAAATPTPNPPTPTTPTPNPQLPSPPSNVTAIARTTSITLSWTASQPGCCAIDGYDFNYMRAFDDVVLPGTFVRGTTVTVTSYVQPLTEYRFWLSARDVNGNRSNGVSISVVTPATDTGSDTVPPAAPTNLIGTVNESASIALRWSPSTDNVGVTGYRVYHWDGWYSSRVLATVTGTTYTTPLPSGPLRNNYYVRAVDAAGNISIASNVVNAPLGPTSPPTLPPKTLPPTTPPAVTCEVTYLNQSEWAGGFTASMTIENTSSTRIDGWTFAFAFGGDQRVVNGWSASYSQTGAEVTVRNLPWNGVIAPGARVSFGFLGSWTASNSPPGQFTLNGDPCTAKAA